MNRLSQERQVQILRAFVEGNSIRSIERMTGTHRDTIMRLMCRVGERELLSRVVFDLLGSDILHPVHEHNSLYYFPQQLVPTKLSPAFLCTAT